MKIYPLYLNGEWIDSGETLTVINPATAEPFAQIRTLPRTRVSKAIEDAHDAFKSWRKVTAKARGGFLSQIASELERRSDEIARVITLENGKPLAQSLGEVAMSVDHLQWFAEEARRAYGRIIPHQVEGKRNLVIKTPIGVAGAISPWNFPLVLGVRKMAPALAAGCTVILKPASQTPISSALFAECVDAAKLPKGVFQLVAGSASEIGQELLENPLCRKISFTGSTEVGKTLIRGAARCVKPLSLELGGQAPVLVFEDADMEKAVDETVIAKFRNTGQSCIAANRIYVQKSIYHEFLDRFVKKVMHLKVGDGLEEGVQIGPLIDKGALNKAADHVEDAIKRHARVLCGGKIMEGRNGFFFEPTVLADVPDDSLCMREETFAPVAPVTSFETEEEAVRRANNSNYGLSAYAFTNCLNRAFRLMENLEAGMLGINDGVPTTSQAPFGGVKQSGWGRELGTEGMEAYLESKHVSIGIS